MSMLLSTKRVSFESHDDVIRYFTKGIAPRKKYAKMILTSLREGTNINVENPKASAFDIPQNVGGPMADVLEVVYEDKKKTQRNLAIGAGVVAAVAGAVLLYKSRSDSDDEVWDDEDDAVEITEF